MNGPPSPGLPIDVGVLGATGTVGQQILLQLADHPWFRVTWLGASQRSAGRPYGDLPWRLAAPRPPGVADLSVHAAMPDGAPRLVLSALDAAVAAEVEPAFAARGHVVVSNARSHRLDPVVPLVVPEVNADHLRLLAAQRREKSWSGAIVTNPNCSTVFLAMVLGALRPFHPRRVLVTTLQAASGAGYPGVASLDLLGNVIPYIEGEEAKIESETVKILGRLSGDRIEPHEIVVSAQATRVPVLDGHTEAISIGFATRPEIGEIAEALASFSGRPQAARLPRAPARPIVCLTEPDRPQPRLDAGNDGGMAVYVGRLRRCPVLDYKLVALGHNTVRGAAGAAVLNAELLVADGWLDPGGMTIGEPGYLAEVSR
jgi:aspartate-semialdehyde dehydrogenase